MSIKIRQNAMLFLSLFIVLSIPVSNNEYFYYFATAYLCLTFGTYKSSNTISDKALSTRATDKVYYRPLMLLVTWCFGIVIGLVRGNPIGNIIRNFAGSICYIFYYVLYNRKVRKDWLIDIVYKSSILASAFTVLAYYLVIRGIQIWPFSNIIFNPFTMRIISTVGVLSYVLEAESIRNFLSKSTSFRVKLQSVLLFCLSACAILITNDMGGYKLGFVFVLGISIYVSMFCAENYTKTKKTVAFIFFLIILSLIVAYDLNYGSVLQNIFSFNDPGNIKRYYQLSTVLSRFKVFGNGLGAEFNYSYGGRLYNSYGIEVSYLNVVDKYGIFAIGVVWIIIKSFTTPIKYIQTHNDMYRRMTIALALCGYMFVAVGNPVLFSGYNVILHCISLYLTTSDIKVKQHERMA